MKVLVTGRGTGGSWSIRGEQLGMTIGAFVEPDAGEDAIRAADVIVVVKRWGDALAERLRSSGKPIVWDVVDAWPQPSGNGWGLERGVKWVKDRAAEIGAGHLVYATKQMQKDIGLPGVMLPHHARICLIQNPIREKVQVVGYEGSARYLGDWGRRIEVECMRRGWRFVLNPNRLADLDIVVAFRSGEWDGELPRRWKSAVKLVNAQGSGTPCILAPEYGYREMARGGEHWAECLTDLQTAFSQLTPQSARIEASRQLLAGAVRLPEVAETYREFLGRIHAQR